jgi:DNA segregation ATPase FtsK/SpoIIIE, S-DNA-T family
MGRGSVVADHSKSRGSKSSENAADDLVESMLVGAAKCLGLFVWWAVRFPLVSVPIVVALSMSVLAGWRLGVVVVVVSVVSYGLWCYLDRESFDRVVWQPIRQSWLTWWRYKRCWEHVCALHELTARLGERTLVPTLQWVNIGATSDVLAVRIVTGQCLADWQKRGDALAEAWRAQRVTIRSATPGELRITLHHGDAVAAARPLPRPASGANADPGAAVVGVTDAGRWWRVPVLGHHILVAGATGSGKGSVVWSLIAALAPGIRAGWVRLFVVDPKGRMEFGRGATLFTGFAYDNSEHTLALLRTVVTVMQKRAEQLRGHTRLHTPTVAAPLIVLVIDELASLTAYIGDRKIRTEVEQLLGLLLSQGRAVGVSVVAAVQDPSKDVLPIRQLFTVRVGLRMTEATQTAMVLGAAARDAGAVCDHIPTATPGVGYVLQDDAAEPIRVRAFHVTDADIDYLAMYFPTDQHRVRASDSDQRRAP